MVVEEPDIEIGAGVSSKGMCSHQLGSFALETNHQTAMSRRIATDQGGRRGPQSSRLNGGRDERYRDDDRRPDRNDRPGSNMPAMPFPMNFSNNPNAMPVFPPGFQFPFQQQYKQD